MVAIPLQKPVDAALRHQIASEVKVEWRQRNRSVSDDLDSGAALAEQANRAELGVLGYANDELVCIAPANHLLHDESLDPGGRAVLANPSQHGDRGGLDLPGPVQIERNASHVRFVGYIRRQDLESDRLA